MLLILILAIIAAIGTFICTNKLDEMMEEAVVIENVDLFCDSIKDELLDKDIRYFSNERKGHVLYSIYSKENGVILYADGNGDFTSDEEVILKVNSEDSNILSKMISR